MTQNKKSADNKRTFKGKNAVRAAIFEKALRHDVRLAYEMCEKHFADDIRLTISGETVLVLARECELKKSKGFFS